jgi:hypothetical protein
MGVASKILCDRCGRDLGEHRACTFEDGETAFVELTLGWLGTSEVWVYEGSRPEWFLCLPCWNDVVRPLLDGLDTAAMLEAIPTLGKEPDALREDPGL